MRTEAKLKAQRRNEAISNLNAIGSVTTAAAEATKVASQIPKPPLAITNLAPTLSPADILKQNLQTLVHGGLTKQLDAMQTIYSLTLAD